MININCIASICEGIIANRLSTASKSGFSLVIFSVLIAITSLVAVVLINKIPAKNAIDRQKITYDRMNTITSKLIQFVSMNQRLPCPADLTAIPGGSTYGVEAMGSTNNCNTSILANTTSGIFQGAAPIRTIGLSDEYLSDGWGNKIEYMTSPYVTVAQGVTYYPNTFINTIGALVINNQNGTAIENKAAYVMVSRGPNGYGAYNVNSATRNAYPPLTLPVERQNMECSSSTSSCGNTYLSQPHQLSVPSNSDDIVMYKNLTDLTMSCLLVTNSYNCTQSPCLNAGHVINWQNTGKTNLSINLTDPVNLYLNLLTSNVPIDGQGTGAYLDLTAALKDKSNTYTLQLTLNSLSTSNAKIVLNYQYATTTAPTTLVTTQLATFSSSQSGVTYNSSNVGQTLNISFGASNHIPKKLYFTKIVTSNSNPTFSPNPGNVQNYSTSMQVSNTQILYPNANQTGIANFKYWTATSGSTALSLMQDSRYPNSSTTSSTITSLQAPTYNDNYGIRITGYITPPTTGHYTFFTTTTKDILFYLSSNANMGTENIASNYGNPSTLGIPVNLGLMKCNAVADTTCIGQADLIANVSYYFEFVVNQLAATDSFNVTWTTPSSAVKATVPSSVLSTAPVTTINTPPTCSTGYTSIAATLTAARSSQPVDIINVPNIMARYVKITPITSQPIPSGNDPTSDAFLLRQVRFITATNSGVTASMLAPTGISVYQYSSALAQTNNYLAYSPVYLLSDTNATSSSYMPASTGSSMNYTAWMTQNKSAPQSIVFDLGATQQLRQLYIWNGNQLYSGGSGTCCPGRSVKDIIITASNDINHLIYQTP